MTVANGREFLSIPGPTNIPDAVLQAMHRPAIDIYSGDMVDLTRTLLEDLPRLFRTSGRVFIYAANGHGGWEAAVSNVLSRGETVLVLESGVFAVGWGDMARMLGIKVEVLKGDWRRAVDPAAVAQRLAAGRFVITAEVMPPVSCNPDDLTAKALPLRGLADAVNVTDGASARAHMSAMAAAALLIGVGIEPILQLTCRDRNRIALQGEPMPIFGDGRQTRAFPIRH